jgi:membrane AbrB-like protein
MRLRQDVLSPLGALALGAGGGWVALQASLPLAWMIGAMLATTAAAMVGLKVVVWGALRTLMLAVLGVMLGSTFRPDMLDSLATWGGSLAGLVVATALAGALAVVYYRRLVGYDLATAYFSAMPGGLAEMTVAAASHSGDLRIVSLSHATRILLVVLIVPLGFQLFLGYEPASRPAAAPGLLLPLRDIALLAACAALGIPAARTLRLPAADMVGPMMLSVAVHLAGLTAATPPTELIAAAQVVIGAGIGCRFTGTGIGLVRRAVTGAAGATAILVGVAIATAETVHVVSGASAASLMLSYMPGGVAEMSLIAIALSVDAAFVAIHSTLRIFIVVVIAPLIFRLLVLRSREGASRTDSQP